MKNVLAIVDKLTPAQRKYLYRVALALTAVLVGYGLLTGELALLWVGVFSAVLGVADRNVSPGPHDE
ncbi:phage holin [Nocardioides alkalitolerans]|uniref:phage holin n=1 Tax=Nocardioides alkalitolerans TaxID=281714 RepID=UPI000427CDE1|nr:hypothetical protein [Nocardioides alkalitolerans]